jgi:hypothetical protein
MIRSRWREALFAVLLASVIVPALPRFAELLRLAWKLKPLSMHARREAFLGDFYRGVEQLQREVPPDERLALISAAPADSLFVNYYLYPHPTRTYQNRWAYAHTDPKKRPQRIVQIDGGVPRIVTYAQMRDAELRHHRVVRIDQLPPRMLTSFAIPIVTSTDGPPADSYTIEGALSSDDDAHVVLTMQPAGIVHETTLRGTQTFYDLVYECFGRMEFAAWVHVSSDRPIRAAFWLVNRRAKTAAALRLVDGPIQRPAAFPVSSTSTLWLVNLSDDPALVHVGPGDALILPRTLAGVNANGTVSGKVYAFLATKLPNGDTHFTWPEDVR